MNLFGVTENDLTLPRRLDAPRQDVTWSRHTTLVVAGLLALALVPRAIMAWKLDTICSDGPLYIYLAKALEAGNFGTAFGRMGINPYPVALAALQHLGLDWETAGKVWGVSLATLCVLPIFGLLRRQFSDGVAVLACVLYAVHPKLIEWSPELIRDQTYWFLFATAAYLLWRAVSEARPWLFVPAAVVSALSVMTRFEGAFLCAAWVAWIGWRLYLSDAEARRRIGFGLVLSLVCLPGLLIALSLIFARHSGVELLGLAPARRVVEFVGARRDRRNAANGFLGNELGLSRCDAAGHRAGLFGIDVRRHPGLVANVASCRASRFILVWRHRRWRRVDSRMAHTRDQQSLRVVDLGLRRRVCRFGAR